MRPFVKASCFALAAILACGSFDIAQAGIAGRPEAKPVPFPSSAAEAVQAQKVMNLYAGCLVKLRRRQVEKYLSRPPLGPETYKEGSKLSNDACMYHGTLRFRLEVLRGVLFENLYRADFKNTERFDFSAVPVIDYTGGVIAPLPQETELHAALIGFSDCAVRKNPVVTRDLIMSEVASKKEAAAFQQLAPKLGDCLIEGVELKFSRAVLRGAIAEALYRLTAAAQPVLAKND